MDCKEKMGTIPETTLVVDDRTVYGIALGNQLGCATCWVMTRRYAHEGPDEDTDAPTYCIDSVRGLLSLLL